MATTAAARRRLPPLWAAADPFEGTEDVWAASTERGEHREGGGHGGGGSPRHQRGPPAGAAARRSGIPSSCWLECQNCSLSVMPPDQHNNASWDYKAIHLPPPLRIKITNFRCICTVSKMVYRHAQNIFKKSSSCPAIYIPSAIEEAFFWRS
jgi:hypothetical protein